MTTPIEVTTNTIQELMDKEILRLMDPTTKEDIDINHPLAHTLINNLADPLFKCIENLNVHRGLDVPDATLPHI